MKITTSNVKVYRLFWKQEYDWHSINLKILLEIICIEDKWFPSYVCKCISIHWTHYNIRSEKEAMTILRITP